MAKEHTNNVKISGLISEIEQRTGVTAKGVDYISGKLMIEVSEDNIIPVSFFSTKTKKDGKPNGIYGSLQTVVNEYKSIATNTRDEADSVEITGAKVRENTFFAPDGTMIRGFQLDSAFFNRKVNVTPEATFTVVGEIVAIKDDIVNDEPTGTITLTLLIVGFGNKANLVDFKVEQPKAVAYVKDVFTQGQEVKVSGQVIIEEIITEKKEEAAFGDPIVQTSRRINRKLLVNSATPPVDSAITAEERATMLAEREAALATAKETSAAKNKGQGKAQTAGNFSL